MHTIEMAVPAKADFVPVLRSVIGGLGAAVDLTIDEVEDLRLAATEACAYLLQIAPGARTLRAQIHSVDGIVQIVTSVDDAHRNGSDDDVDAFITWHLLGVLTDDARLEWTEGGPSIRFHKARVGA